MTTIRHAVATASRAAALQAPVWLNDSRREIPDQRLRGWVGAVALSMLGLCGVASAQQAQPPATSTANGASAGSVQQPATLQEVEVTGSRIRRTTDFNTPTPTTVIDTATMESLGIVNVGQALTLTPANVSTFTPANTGNANFFTGEFIADLRGLNPYFGSRTLVLINGQRIVNSNQGDSFDLNLLPQILVSRIDTVTGGASAAYGSGAIAGVENVILDNTLEGGKLDGDFYQTSHSDGRDRHLGAAYGHGLFDNRIHFVIGGEYEASDAVGCENARSWCAQNEGAYEVGTVPTSVGGGDIIAFGSNVRAGYNGTTGVLLPQGALYPAGALGPGAPASAGPLSAVTFSPDGSSVSPYYTGSPPPVAFSDDATGGQGTPLYQYTNLQAPVNRGVGMLLVNGQATDTINFNTSFLISREATTNYLGAGSTVAGSISGQNAYACPNTPGTGSALGAVCANADDPSVAAAIGTGAYLDKDWTDQIPALTRFTTNVQRFTFGLDGKFGDSSWTWDANYEYGLTHHDQLVQDNYSLYRIDMALDSVIDPATGLPVCRVTLDGFAGAVAANPGGGYADANPLLAQGCVPIDPFGTTPLNAAAINYAFGDLIEDLRYEQTDGTLNASGNIFEGIGAGPFTAAVGYEWRQERGDNIDQPGEPAYLADDYETQYGSSFGGLMTVNEEYLEFNLPLLKNEPGAHLLEFDVAGRESEYSNNVLYGVDICPSSTPAADCLPYQVPQGSTFDHNFPTWKFSGIYEPLDWLRFRASQSRDERSPNFRELYYNQVIGAGGIFGYCGPTGTFIDPCTWNLLGNANLKPETSNTTTIGIVLTPRDVLPGFQFSADWYHIKITNAIEQANPVLVEDGCRAGLVQYCDQITFGSVNYTSTGGTGCPGLTGPAAYQAGCFNISQLNPTSYNGAYYEVRGIDFSMNYLYDLGKYGTVNTRLLTTWTGEQVFQEACIPNVYCPTWSILGQTGAANGFLNDYTPDARWRGSLLVTWANGPWSITPNMQFVSRGVLDFLGVTPNEGKVYTETLDGTLPFPYNTYGLHPMPYNYVPSYFVFGLNGTYQFEDFGPFKGLQLFAQINNLFNKTPPFAGGGGDFGPSNGYGGTNPIFFDTMGLAYRIGFRVNF